MVHHASTIKRREDDSIDTGHYVDRGNKLHAEEMRNALAALARWLRALWPPR